MIELARPSQARPVLHDLESRPTPSGSRFRVDHPSPCCDHGEWSTHFLPNGLLFPSYLAGEKEPRLSVAMLQEADGALYIDFAVGVRVPIIRHGTDSDAPQGWQLDFEGAAFPRTKVEEANDLEAADFRFGVPLTFRQGPLALKLAYYHISSHVGDEFLERNIGFVRVNYVRDGLQVGARSPLTADITTYAEAAYAFYVSGGAEPWEFQFGSEYEPESLGCDCGVPYLAMNVHLREEVGFGGSLNVVAGWKWGRLGRRLGVGLQYFVGKSGQYSFFNERDELVGLMVWFDP